MTQIISQCSVCKHFNKQDRTNETCAAFPEGIPREIVLNEVDHRGAADGDHGVRWEKDEDAPPHLGHPLG